MCDHRLACGTPNYKPVALKEETAPAFGTEILPKVTLGNQQT